MRKWFEIPRLLVLIGALMAIACQSKNAVIQSNSSNTNSIGDTLVVKPQPNIHSKVCGMMSELKYNGEDAKSFILSQPLPKIWIVEKGKDNTDEVNCDESGIDLSDQSKRLLQQHWQDRLEYNFLHDFVKSENSAEGIRRDTKLSKSYIETKRRLEESSITVDGKIRNLTSEESDQMLIFLRDSANAISQVIKK